ncbi:hypothetical protein [Mesorhizobium sp. M0146]|uniref:hypothetical protein n=1 Tax=unclassified Mesorhizobium TaxID=325217 RepID=UPI00333AE572
MTDTIGARVTVDRLPGGLYAGAEANASLADSGSRRYHPFSFDFDSTPMSLEDPGEHWEEKVRELHLQNRERRIERLKETTEPGGMNSLCKTSATSGTRLSRSSRTTTRCTTRRERRSSSGHTTLR